MGNLDPAGLMIMLIVFAAAILVAVFYLKNIQDTLKEVSPHNQQMPPANVWLMFIPLFNIVYGFIMYPKISESLRLEFEERGDDRPGDYLKNLGITMPILNVCGVIPVLGGFAALANLIILIIYWVKLAEFKTQLQMGTPASGMKKTFADNDLLD